MSNDFIGKLTPSSATSCQILCLTHCFCRKLLSFLAFSSFLWLCFHLAFSTTCSAHCSLFQDLTIWIWIVLNSFLIVLTSLLYLSLLFTLALVSRYAWTGEDTGWEKVLETLWLSLCLRDIFLLRLSIFGSVWEMFLWVWVLPLAYWLTCWALPWPQGLKSWPPWFWFSPLLFLLPVYIMLIVFFFFLLFSVCYVWLFY